jgi:pheromone shutdown-related protein TraB
VVTAGSQSTGPSGKETARPPGGGPSGKLENARLRRLLSVLAHPAPGVTLVGTAHISPASVALVEETIRAQRPAKVLVELDTRRLEALQNPEAWRKTDIVQVIKQGKQHLFLLQLYLGSVQSRLGRETGVSPGAELLKAVQVAKEIDAEVVLIDRDIAITLKRGFGSLSMWARMRLFWNVWVELLTPAKGEEQLDVDALLKTDAITKMTEEFARFAPAVKTALIDERDAYMASHIQEIAAKTSMPTETGQQGGVVAVVGAGHLAGITDRIKGNVRSDRVLLDQPPRPKLSMGKFLAWAIPLALVGVFAWLGYQGVQEGNFSDLGQAIGWFVLITGTSAAIGAAVAFGHPWSILTAFAAAPIGTLHPLIASGWFAGLVEAKVRTPTVADFEGIKQIETLKQFWRNGVVRILLVTALTNVGAMIGFWIATGRVLQILGGQG